jgi:hypothetical protein
MGSRLREQLKVIWDAVVGNTAWSVLTVIVGSSSVALCLETSRAWLFRKHAITLEGWSLVGAILLCLSGIVLPTEILSNVVDEIFGERILCPRWANRSGAASRRTSIFSSPNLRSQMGREVLA